MPTSEKNRDLLIWCAIWLFILSIVVMGVGYVSLANRATSNRTEKVLNGTHGKPGALARIEKAAIDAQTAAGRADHTLTSIVDQFTKAAADPANIAAQLRSRERLIAICEAVSSRCPAEPTTTTTTIGPPAPDS